ncbi:MAG: DUF374 domain-containing protein [Planctomycetota bacterium]|jgi:lysophospholipid acyltransferase (LPLAT)-like uncharacterized protein
MKHQPVVTNFRVRRVTYPDGHWMNRFWGPLARLFMAVAGRVPFYRYVLRVAAEAEELLDRGDAAVFACVHQDMGDCFNGLPRLMQERRLAAMVSYSRDGGLAAMGLRMLGYEVVRGSSSRGGGEGLVVLRSYLTAGTSVVMVCDGPKAPLGDVKPGVVRLAASARVPILPVRAWGLNRWRFEHSWTKAAVSLPFLPVVICVGAPIDVPGDVADTRPYQLRVAETIAELATWASLWANGPRRAPFTVSTR